MADYSNLREWAYFPNLRDLICQLEKVVLPGERWCFGSEVDNQNPFPILWNYLKYTYFRLFKEHKIKTSSLSGRDVASFNTGLVDKRYEPIYAFFDRNLNLGRQPWYFKSFCIAGENLDGKDLVRCFRPLPPPPHYFSRVEDMIYDVNAGEPEVDWEHVIIENIDRLPLPFLEEQKPKDFTFRPLSGMTFNERDDFFNELRNAIEKDARTYRAIKNRLADALELAIKRTRWNFKTAIPQYYPRNNEMTLLLPLAIISDDKIDIALVVEKTHSGNYLGHTILPLDWAYMNARLVCRPDSDWLVPSTITDASDRLGTPHPSEDDVVDTAYDAPASI
jgi:hypothetical protein